MPEDISDLLKWGADLGMSDLTIYPQSPAWLRLHGDWLRVTERPITGDEIFYILDQISRNEAASAQIKGGDDLPFSYEILVGRGQRKRFRCHATGCKDGWGNGVSIVFRTIPEHPPKLEDLGVDDDLLKDSFPNNGLVLVTGTMGSGKSTLIAAMLRHIGQDMGRKHIVTYEEPVEFDIMSIPKLSGPIIQSAVPYHVKDFMQAIRNSTRRAPDVILVGEARDPETIKGMIEASEVGVTAYSTVHTRSVAETPTRIINVFPNDQQPQIASTFLSSVRMIIQQRLLPSLEGGRAAVTEYLAFDKGLRMQLMDLKRNEFIPAIEDMVYKHGKPLIRAAQERFDQGLIDQYQLDTLIKERKGDVVA